MQEENEFRDEFAPSQEQQDENPELAPESVKDRRHRRLEKALQESREMNIALTERVKAISETTRFKDDTGTVDTDVHTMLYGDIAPTDETRASAQAVQRVLERNAKQAEDKAFDRLQKSMEESSREVDENAKLLERGLEDIEDNFDVDLSGETEESKKVRNGFLDYVAKLSPKDKDGNIIAYADMETAWETYNARRERTNIRNRNISSRSMTNSNSSESMTDAQKAATEKYLLEHGFI